MKKIVLIFLDIILVILLSVVIIVNITPRPVVWLANALIFGGAPESSTLPNYNEMEAKVTITKDEVYTSAYPENTFDVYTPNKEPGKTYPVIFWVHGGGFVGGDKSMIENYGVALASEGYTVIALNYSVAPDYVYPTPVIQTKEFVDFVLTNKEKYNIDASKLFFAGDSAGAQIVSQFVITQTNANYASEVGIEQVVPESSIKGMLLYCGPYELTGLANSDNVVFSFIFSQIGWSYIGEKDWVQSPLAKQASIVDNVNADFPPAYITDGNTASFESMGRNLADKLRSLNVDVRERFYSVDEFVTGHEYQFIMGNVPGQTTYQDTVQFLKERLQDN
ncbi:alpha/beta hydrolase [Culicoidibacter larvae]|uniref:Alpha/beta hydrolase n=1 Tax=Culicoidibacter larvae TaxID=2579976 RepID=A0A5R8Q9Z9_9FIRM|nr:alpha/beta hydrolase [Culicoidibacter larvae]TLG72753.1 alpha/beta hydrolase [Culicoidibacter larvae]